MSDLRKKIAPKRGGRPKVDPEAIRKPYGVRFTKDELLEARQGAAEARVQFSDYCRSAILGARTPRQVPPANLTLWAEASRMSDVVSTLTHQLEDRPVTGADLLAEVRTLSALIQRARLELLGVEILPGDSE